MSVDNPMTDGFGAAGGKPIRSDKPPVELSVREERGLSEREAQATLTDLFTPKKGGNNGAGQDQNRSGRADSLDEGVDTTDRRRQRASQGQEDRSRRAAHEQEDDPPENGDDPDRLIDRSGRPIADENTDEDLDVRVGDNDDDIDSTNEDETDQPQRSEGARAADDDDAFEAGSEDENGDIPIKYKGREYKVPRPLVDGAMRQAQYTKATTELAEGRDTLAVQARMFDWQRKEFEALAAPTQQLHTVRAQLRTVMDSEPDPVTGTDVQFRQHDKLVRDLRRAEQELVDVVSQRRTELQTEKQSADAELLRASFKFIAGRVKGWGPDKGKEVTEYLSTLYSPQEIESLQDPRIVVLAHDAMMMRRLRDTKPAVRNRVANAAPMSRPTGQPNANQGARTKMNDAIKRARRTGRETDAVNAMASILKAGARRR